MMKEKNKYEEYQRDPDFYVDLTEVKINVFVFVLIFTVKKYLNFLNSHMTLAEKVVPVPKKVQKKNPVSQSVEGFRRGCFRSKYKGFPNFLLLSVRFQCFSNLFLNCQIKTPYRPNLPLIEKRVFFCLDYFGTTFPASVIYYVRVQSSTSLITQSVSSVSP